MKKTNYFKLNLQLFSTDGAETVTSETDDNLSADVGQEETNGVVNEFQSLIDGKFKDEFHKKTQSIIDKRFKETKLLEDYKNKTSVILEKLSEFYGVEDGNIEALTEKINEVTSKSNEENNVEATKSLKEKVHSWVKEGEALKEVYENFDFRNELKNNSLFGKLLYTGIPLKTAYEVVHKDEILSDAMAYTAQKVREQVVKGIEAKGLRPVENGIASESGIITVTDVNSLTSQDILKILKKVENGVSVKF
ncbi:MAG: hypothetical protein IKT89_04070 [Clostridia bacterium]|nr:hypothetical protein [Clostridia bacterium]